MQKDYVHTAIGARSMQPTGSSDFKHNKFTLRGSQISTLNKYIEQKYFIILACTACKSLHTTLHTNPLQGVKTINFLTRDIENIYS